MPRGARGSASAPQPTPPRRDRARSGRRDRPPGGNRSMLHPPHRRPEYRRAYCAGTSVRWTTLSVLHLASRFPATRLDQPWCAGRDRGHGTERLMGATHGMRKMSRAGKRERRTSCSSACGWQSRATSLAFLLTASLMAQGFDWSPALAATCEIPAVVSSDDRLPATASPPLRRRPLTPRSSRSKVRPNQRRRPPSPPP